MSVNKKKFIYLISPPKIYKSFYTDLISVIKQKKLSFFQLRLKRDSFKKKLLIGRKLKKICKRFNIKFLINDDVFLAKKLNAPLEISPMIVEIFKDGQKKYGSREHGLL